MRGHEQALAQRLVRAEHENRRVASLKRQAEARFHELSGSLSEGWIWVDLEGVIRSSNRAFEKMVGYGAEQLASLEFPQLTTSDWRSLRDGALSDPGSGRSRSEAARSSSFVDASTSTVSLSPINSSRSRAIFLARERASSRLPSSERVSASAMARTMGSRRSSLPGLSGPFALADGRP